MLKTYPKWVWAFVFALLLLSSAPYIFGALIKPEGSTYFGVHTNFDDHAVYAAWTKQSAEGNFFFENRFAVEEQPKKTVHLYFWAIGKLASLTGIPLAMHIGKLLFTLLFSLSLYTLITKITKDDATQKWAFAGSLFFGGMGWLFWKNYGNSAPIDTWQPEAFIFPSVMTNGLFSVSLFLIVSCINSILDCRNSFFPAIKGATYLFFLTNIHTYDTLLLALICIPFLIFCIGKKLFSWSWFLRSSIVAAGAIPPILWFVYVRTVDSVFAARAATVTNSPPPIQIWLSIAVLFCLAMVGLLKSDKSNPALLLVGAWAIVAPWVVYYPGLFQRKLAMGMGLPLGILSGLAIAFLLTTISSKTIKLAFGVLLAAILSASNLRWMIRESKMAELNLSNTTVHSIFADKSVTEILNYLRENKKESDVLIAMPGIPSQVTEDVFVLGIPDLNPVMTGWAGIKTYAGHWSETPNYLNKRQEVALALFVSSSTSQTAKPLLQKSNATYVILPNGPYRNALSTPGPEILWEGAKTVVETENWLLIKKP